MCLYDMFAFPSAGRAWVRAVNLNCVVISCPHVLRRFLFVLARLFCSLCLGEYLDDAAYVCFPFCWARCGAGRALELLCYQSCTRAAPSCVCFSIVIPSIMILLFLWEMQGQGQLPEAAARIPRPVAWTCRGKR